VKQNSTIRNIPNPEHNDPCNFEGLDVCDKNRNGCDSENFDCVTDLPNGKYCTTGMCPGDDDKASWKNQEFVGCDKDNDKDNKKKVP
jgi:hypothetical protein